MGRQHQPVDIESTDLESVAKNAHVDVAKLLWGRKTRHAGVDMLMESANLAENLIQGGKELGRNILKKAVS